MAPPPRIRNITRESLPGAPAWVDPLLLQLNESLSQTTFALSKGLTFSENSQAQLKDISFVAPSPVWTPFTLVNGWVDFVVTDPSWGPAGYRIEPGGRVLCRGLIRSGTPGTVAATFPVGYRPEYNVLPAVDSNMAYGNVLILQSGTMTPNTGSTNWFSLGQISFQAASPCALPSAPTVLAMVSHSLPSVGGVVPVFCRASVPLAGVSNGAPHVDWEEAATGQVRIKTIHGLQPGVRYTMRLLLFSR